MQLLVDYATTDYAQWKASFDARCRGSRAGGPDLHADLARRRQSERGHLSLQVNDRKRAQDWLDREAAFGAAATARFLKTA